MGIRLSMNKIYNIFAVLLFMAMITNYANAQTNQRYYWVGGGINNYWGTIGNWSNTSGGMPAVGITNAPTNVNTVIFDQNSFLNGDTVIIIDGAVQCDSLIVQNCTKKPYFNFANNTQNNISINGSMFLQKGTILSGYNIPIIKFVSSRAEETLFTDSLTINGNILLHGGINTVWNLDGYTQFNEISIVDGAFNVLGNDLYVTSNFSYNGNANVNLRGKNIIGGSYFLVGNGNIDLDSINIYAHFSYNGNGNVEMSNATIFLGNFYLYGNGFLRLDNTKAIDAYNINIGTNGGMSLINSNISCYNWVYSGINISAAQSANSLIKAGRDFYTTAANYNNVELYSEGTISGGTYNKVSILTDNPFIIINILTDTLLIFGKGSYCIANNTVNILKYFEAKPQACGGQLRLYSSNSTYPYMLTFGSTAVVDIQKALIHDLTVNRAITAVKSHDWGNNTNITFTTPDAGRDLYWTGGTGDWNDPAHWRLDNNSPANCIPTLVDNVFFNAASASGGQAFTIQAASNAYCNSMTWTVVPRYSSINGNASIYINGSLTLHNNMAFNLNTTYFTGDLPTNTITSNGVLLGSGFLYFQSVSGMGKWKILDNLQTRDIYFNRGYLDLNGHNVSLDNFYCIPDNNISGFSGKSSSRTIDFHNSTISCNNWSYVGGQQITSLYSANSLILVNNSSTSKGDDYYYNVNHIGANGANQCYGGTSYFNKIIFDNTIQGTLNSGSGAIYPDSLVFTRNTTYYIYDSLPVRKYLSTPILNPCDKNTKLKGYNDAIILMATNNPVLADRVRVQNTEITDINILNGPYDVMNCNILGTSTGWNNIGNNASGNNNRFYWVGGTGYWSDPAHWANTSGGVGGSAGCIPTDSNTVVFDNNSGLASKGQYLYECVYLDVLAYCDSMLWIGADTLRPYFITQNNSTVTINGSLEMQRRMTFYDISLYFVSNRPNETVKTNGVALFNLSFNGTSTFTLLDTLLSTGNCYFSKGTLDFNGQYVKANSFNGDTRSVGGLLNIKNSEIHIYYSWYYIGDLLADNSIIYCRQTMTAEQTTTYTAHYHNVELYYNSGISSINNGKYNKVNILSPANITKIETDTLILSAAANYIYQFGDTLRVNKAYFGMGTPCKQIYLQSQSETIQAVFDIKAAAANFPNDTLLIDYVYLHGIKALTGSNNAKLKKGSKSPDVNKAGASWGYGIGTDNYNLAWAAMETYNAGGSTYFGEDRIVPCLNGFPYTLYSDNFLPSYGATFEWRKDNLTSAIIASTPVYAVMDSGTYYLTVNYGNACMVTDDIHFSIISIDSIRETICYGETYSGWNLVNLDSAGLYISHYISSTGCDSLVYLTLSIHPQVDTTRINTYICKGEVYDPNGFNETAEGFYIRTTPNINGCDSVITLNLSYYPDIDTTFIHANICQGSYYTQNGFNENQAGIHCLTVQSIKGCDSLTVLNLTVNPVDNTTLNATICDGNVYVFFGQNLTTAGTYTHTLSNQYGCDSIIELILSINHVFITPIVASICQDMPYSFAGKYLSTAGIYRDTLQTLHGCDSIIELTLSIDSLIPDFEITTTGILCEDKHVELMANVNDVNYQWSTGETTQSISVSEEGLYSVHIEAGLCQTDKDIEVTCPCKMLLFNIFTPNGDGFNDTYIPEITFELHSFSMVIYDRWGSVAYKTNNFIPWDGKVNGKEASAGVYYCVVEYSNKNAPDKKCIAQSSITLVR